MKGQVTASQVRIPTDLHNYIQQEATRLGIAQNAFLVVLLEQGKKLWEASATIYQKAK